MRADSNNVQWQSASGSEEKLQRLNALYKTIESSQKYRRSMNIHHMRLYCDRDLYGAGGYGFGNDTLEQRRTAAALQLQARNPRLSLNVIRNMINAATSQMSRGRPRPQYLTNGGDWDEQQRAKKRTQFIEAVFQKENSYLLGQRMVQCGSILGTGAIKVVRDYDSKRVRHEYAYTGELLVDETEAVYGDPRNLMQVRAMDRIVAKEMYPSHESDIDRASSANSAPYTARTGSDQIVLIEAWRLPSVTGGKDGRHAVFCDTAVLFDEQYMHGSFPFAFWRWEEDPLGFWGTGIASELNGIQFEVNETIRSMQANWWQGGNLKVLVERGSRIIKAHLNNDIRGTIVEYTGTPPAWIANEAVAPGLMNYLQYLVEQAYQITGISQLNAQSQTPAASMSGRARLIADNNESQRFLTAQRRYESAFMALAERTMEAASDIFEEKGDFEVLYRDREYMRGVKFSEIGELDGPYEIQVYPTSILPSTPAGKMAMVERFEGMGYIDKDQAVQLLDFPDLKRETDFDTGWKDLIDQRIHKMVSDKVYLAPHPDMPLDLAVERVLKSLAFYEVREVPDDRLEMLRKFRQACVDLLKAQTPPTPPAAAPGPMGGVPALPPGAAASPMPDAAAVPLITGQGQAA